jgi:hypothetical protein
MVAPTVGRGEETRTVVISADNRASSNASAMIAPPVAGWQSIGRPAILPLA